MKKKDGKTEVTAKDSTQSVKTHQPQVQKPALTDGEYSENYPDGKLKIKGEIKNGARSGAWVAYYPDGVKQSESHYEDGKKNGKTATFYPNGKVRYIGYYQWDEPIGTWEFYNEDGNLAKTKEYK